MHRTTTHDAEHDPRNDAILIWVNGELKPRAEATVSVYDSGFLLGDGMIGDSLLDVAGLDMVTVIGTVPGTDSPDADTFNQLAQDAGITGTGPYRGESYDAAALMILGMQAGGSADRGVIADEIMAIANAPGEKIGPGELGKALEMIKNGEDVDYQGATGVEFTDVGEAQGSYKELEIQDGAWVTVTVR